MEHAYFLTLCPQWKENRDRVTAALHQINATDGKGHVTGWTYGESPKGHGIARRMIPVTQYTQARTRPFTFRLYEGRDGQIRLRALGRTVLV